MQHYMHVQTIASVGYWRKFHSATGIRLILTHCRWTLSHAASPLCCPAATALSALQPLTALFALQPPTALCWVASSTLIRVPLPLPDTARFHVQESFVWFRAKTDSSALAAYAHSATYHPLLPLSFILNKLQHNSTTSKRTKTFTVSNNQTYKILKGFGRPLKKKNNK